MAMLFFGPAIILHRELIDDFKQHLRRDAQRPRVIGDLHGIERVIAVFNLADERTPHVHTIRHILLAQTLRMSNLRQASAKQNVEVELPLFAFL